MEQEALDAIAAAILVYRAARKQLERAIAIRKLARKEVDEEHNLRAGLSRKITNSRFLEAELQAGLTVVSAPSVEEIREVKELVTEINDLAVADAARRATLTLVKKAVDRADSLRGKVKPKRG